MAALYPAGLLPFIPPPEIFQQPLPQTGENKKHLVSEEEFRKCFAHPYGYGKNNSDWPGETILLYKYRSNATTKYQNIPENTWKRIDNELGRHAEFIMRDDLEKIQNYLMSHQPHNEGSYKGILSVEVILNYSPCASCSESLCSLKKEIDEEVKQFKTRNEDTDNVVKKLSALSLTTEVEDEEKVKFKITFSNFYNHLDGYRSADQNKKGLKDLLKSDIKLDTFSDDNWYYFFNAAGWFNAERQKRERDDKKILQYLERSVALYKMQEALEETELDFKNNDLL